MPTPHADSYSAGSGAKVYGGRFHVFEKWAGDIVVAGDSLTDPGYPSAGYRAGLPMTLHPPRVIYNAGITNNTTTDLLNRFDADVIAKGAQIAMVRIGTNGGSIPSDYTAMFGKLKTAGMKGIFHAIPPKGLGTAGVMSPNDAINVWLKAACEADPDWLQFVDDSRDLGDAYYNCIPSYFIDNIHMNGKGVMAQGRAMAPRLQSILVQNDPRIMDASDKYPSNAASNQYVQNALMAGAGDLPTGWSVGAYGASTTGGTSIVAADVGDPVQVPWLRVTFLTGGGGGYSFSAVAPMQNPAIDASIKRFDIVAEMRFVNLDTSKAEKVAVSLGAGANAIAGGNITLGGGGVINDHLVYRDSISRDTSLAYSANQLSAAVSLTFGDAFITPIGSIDIRCVSVKGMTS